MQNHPRKEPHAEASRHRRRRHPRCRSRHRPRQRHGGQCARLRDRDVDRGELVHRRDLLGAARLRRLPTTKIEFQVPESVIEVTPTVNPNWTIRKATEPYTAPSAAGDDEHEAAAERVTSVTYTAKTPLPADERDTFALSFALPDGEPGDLVEFPALQTCEQGSVEWNQEQQPGEAEPEHPAPSITLTAAEATDDDGDAAAATPAAEAAGTSAPADPDLVGRFLGLGGLVLGAVALVVAVAGTRRRSSAK